MHHDEDRLAGHFGFEKVEWIPRYNLAPTQQIAIIHLRRSVKEWRLVRWGLVPSWARDPSRFTLINARAETLAEKPSFKQAYRWRRCLIPASGFYEWQTRGKVKQAFYIRLKSREPFAFAGLWEEHRQAGTSCAIITTKPNELMRPLHHRMPVILAPEDYAAWLKDGSTGLLRPLEDGLLDAYPVSKEVNSVRNDHPGLIE